MPQVHKKNHFRSLLIFQNFVAAQALMVVHGLPTELRWTAEYIRLQGI